MDRTDIMDVTVALKISWTEQISRTDSIKTVRDRTNITDMQYEDNHAQNRWTHSMKTIMHKSSHGHTVLKHSGTEQISLPSGPILTCRFLCIIIEL
jgi:hypothetical protein